MEFEDRCQEETKSRKRCARGKAWNLARNFCKLEQQDKAAFCLPTEKWIMPAASTIKPKEREFVVDSGASMHMVNKRDLTSAEVETMRISKNPTTVQTRREATVYVKELHLFVTVMLLEETPAVLSLGKLCEDHGCTYHWTSGQKPHLTKNVKRNDCNIFPYVPFVVPGLSTSSSATPTPTSSSSSSQDSVLTSADTPRIQYPKEVEVRVRSYGETRCINQQKPKIIIKMKDAKKYTAIYCMNCRIGCRNSENIWSMNVVLGATVKCDIFSKTNITRASCRRRAGTVMPRADNFGDLMTADQKILGEGSESRNNRRYAVVVQDLATQWLQFYPCKTITSQEAQKSLMKFLEPTKKPKVIYFTLTIPQNLASLVKNYPGIIVRRHYTDQKQM